MPDQSQAAIRALCRERLIALNLSPTLEDQVARIVHENLDSGRFERFQIGRTPSRPLTLPDYIELVLHNVCSEQARIAALERGDAAAWQQLGAFLAARAWRMIRRFRLMSKADTEAWDFAHDACLTIFEERYPFDVAFEAWATVILKNIILTRYMRSSDGIDRSRAVESIDRPHSFGAAEVAKFQKLLSNGGSPDTFEQVENQMVLLDAIQQLKSKAQRHIIQYAYFEELDDVQIAKRLGRSKQAVYNLRNRALARLRQLLTPQQPQEKQRFLH